MKKIIFIICLSIILPITVFGQVGVDIRNYKLSVIPSTTPEEDAIYQKDKALGLIFNFVYEYYVNDAKEFEFWSLEHKAIKFYDLESAKEFNKLNFGYMKTENIHKLIVRIIKNGEVIKTFGKKDIEKDATEAEGEEESESEIFIKIPDLEVGSIIEYLVVYKKDNFLQSGSLEIQFPIPFKNCNFTFVMPEHLKPFFKVYNVSLPIIDTVIESKELRFTTVHADFLPGIVKEPESFYQKYFCRVEFNLAYNLSKSKSLRMNTTNEFVNDFYDRVQLTDKKMIKAVKKDLIKKIKIPKNSSELDKIILIENSLKEQIGRISIGAIQAAKIWGYVFDHFDIKYDLVLTTNKIEKEFDKSYNGSNFFEYLLFYIPSEKYYIDPIDYSYRNGLIPMNYTENQAIRLEKTSVGNTNSFVKSPITLPKSNPKDGLDVLKLNYKIDFTSKAIVGTIERSTGSYILHSIQAAFNSFEVEDREQIIDVFLTFDSESSNITNEEFVNTDPKDIGKNPMIFKANMKNTEWVKFENETIEVSIGKMIGKQARLENKTPRQLPVEKEYSNSYEREIILEIPDGYKIEDPSKLAYSVYDTDSPETASAAFISKYEIKGNKLIVTIKEYYNKLYYPLSEYSLYERVANASADFNDIKIKLIK